MNRIDDVGMFHPRNRADIDRIIDLELSKVYERISRLGLSIELSDAAKTFVADKGYDKQYGARPLKRSIQTYVEDVLAEYMLQHSSAELGKIVLTVNETGDGLRVSG